MKIDDETGSPLQSQSFSSGGSDDEHRRAICPLALSRAETILLSSAGDVVVCRCRQSPYPQFHGAKDDRVPLTTCESDINALCYETECDDLSMGVQEVEACFPWGRRTPPRGGLLGGSPAEVAPLPHLHAPSNVMRFREPRIKPPKSSSPETIKEKAHQAFRSPPIQNLEEAFDEESIIPFRSFDYSHFVDDGNDMISENEASPAAETREKNVEEKVEPRHPQLIHGVPMFLSELVQVKITQVSAHPLGSHVLMISDAGLLYSYGLNDNGQLGVGIHTSVSGFHRGYVMNPTIVTPLVENGGKALVCAAGVNHSLVVVMTSDNRVRSHSGQNGESGAMVHHQMYGFGRNDYMKIGLVSPRAAKGAKGDEMESVALPRRVALRCKVHGNSDPWMPPLGIFAVAASEDHSAALVHKASGDVELYTWGNATFGALGLPQHTISGFHSSPRNAPAVRVVPVPSFVASLSKSSNVEAQPHSLLFPKRGEYPSAISLGRSCSFVTTSIGRVFSFGSNEDGMLGLPNCPREVYDPQEVQLPREARGQAIVSVSAGAYHAIALSNTGAVYTWGSRLHAGNDRSQNMGNSQSIPINESSTNGSSLYNVAFSPEHLVFPLTPQMNGQQPVIVSACAGYDSSMFVTESGYVLSCGRSSGRLGLGETADDVSVPQHAFGGLRLWYRPTRKKDRRKAPPKPGIPKKPLLKRNSTVS